MSPLPVLRPASKSTALGALLALGLCATAAPAQAARPPEAAAPLVESLRREGPPGRGTLHATLRTPAGGFTEAALEAASRVLIAAHANKGLRHLELWARDASGRQVRAASLLPKPPPVPRRPFQRVWRRPLVTRLGDGEPLAGAPRSQASSSAQNPPRSGPIASAPGQTQGFLSGKTVYVSPGHGWTHAADDTWYTQRGNTWDIAEDLSNAEAVDQFLIPYLRNAGATVFCVREADLQESMVIVDESGAGYSEEGSGFRTSTAAGFAPGRAPYTGTQNPMQLGATRELVGGPGSTALGRWTPTLAAAGSYAVYVSYAAGTDRAPDAHYVVKHPGGETHFRVDQRRHGQTWVALGTFHFEAGADAARGAVELRGDSAQAGAVLSLDAVRFGGGMGDVVRGTGVSGKRRWEENARYYAQFSGAPESVYHVTTADGDDDVSTRSRYAAWQHEPGEDAVYVSWHTNAPSPARGTSTYVYGPNGPDGTYNFTGAAGSDRLGRLVHDELVGDLRASWEATWRNIGLFSAYFGEINPRHNNEMPSALVEVAFHSTEADASALKEARFRQLAARAIYQGIARFFAEKDATPVKLSPEPPVRLVVHNDGRSRVRVRWQPPVAQASGGDVPTGYRVYRSGDGRAWDNGTPVTATETTLTAAVGELVFVRVSATNAGGESFPTPTLAARAAPTGEAPMLLVMAFDRLDSGLLVREVTPGLGTLSRMILSRINSYAYVREHAFAAAAAGVSFDSAHSAALANDDLALARYHAVGWMGGQEATADESFSTDEQARVRAFAAAGGALLVTGSEIAWDLGWRGAAGDQAFLREVLQADYAADDGMAPRLTGVGDFAEQAPLSVDDGSFGTYAVGYPDVLTPAGAATPALVYEGSTRVGAIYAPGLVYVGVPLEALYPAEARQAFFARAMALLGVADAPYDGGGGDGGVDGGASDGGAGDGGSRQDGGAGDGGSANGRDGGLVDGGVQPSSVGGCNVSNERKTTDSGLSRVPLILLAIAASTRRRGTPRPGRGNSPR